jgi:DNA-binding CsgD family transcriptional regulator
MSARALDVLERARAGQSTKTIARALDTTPLAIHQLFRRIGNKLGARTRRACVQLAVEYCLM